MVLPISTTKSTKDTKNDSFVFFVSFVLFVVAVTDPTGSEPFGATPCPGTMIRNPPTGGAAESGAVADEDLARVVAAWPNLPAEARRKVLALLGGS
jgi:hypothetical protein